MNTSYDRFIRKVRIPKQHRAAELAFPGGLMAVTRILLSANHARAYHPARRNSFSKGRYRVG